VVSLNTLVAISVQYESQWLRSRSQFEKHPPSRKTVYSAGCLLGMKCWYAFLLDPSVGIQIVVGFVVEKMANLRIGERIGCKCCGFRNCVPEIIGMKVVL
jgi:hypothetical protein